MNFLVRPLYQTLISGLKVNAKDNLSEKVSSVARFRPRLATNSCCRRAKFSAANAFTPPGRMAFKHVSKNENINVVKCTMITHI